MKNFCFGYFFVIILSVNVVAQEESKQEIKIDFGGYVNWTAIYDSRQVVAARESHFLLYPKAEQLNSFGKDMNAVDNFQMAVIQTRLSSKISGLNFLNAKTSGLVEAEFMGNSDSDINGFRIRHAYVNLNWENINLLLGQFWNPLFNTEMFPDQIGSNGGAPFQPFARNPQIRLTLKTGDFKTILAIASQRDYTSTGPNGNSSEYFRNAIIPDIHLQFYFNSESNLFGLGGQFKQLSPGSKNGSGYQSDDKVNGMAAFGLMKISVKPITIKLEALYGSNLTDYTMLGGYAVQSIDTLNMKETFTPIKSYSLWADLIYTSVVDFGLFVGFTKNLGSDETIGGSYYSRGSNIDKIFRVAPRVQYKEGNLKIALELEQTTAYYGSTNSYGRVTQSEGINNTRIYTSVYYFFL